MLFHISQFRANTTLTSSFVWSYPRQMHDSSTVLSMFLEMKMSWLSYSFIAETLKTSLNEPNTHVKVHKADNTENINLGW